jgi:hypothetical protein
MRSSTKIKLDTAMITKGKDIAAIFKKEKNCDILAPRERSGPHKRDLLEIEPRKEGSRPLF